MKIAFLASHNGSTARAITLACIAGDLAAVPALLISNNTGSKALEWARDMGLKTAVINGSNTQDPDQAIADLMADHDIDLVICSGYMRLVGPETIRSVHGAILNIHPALLPLYGGQGMYGSHVHKAVFENKETQTGITIHLVDGEYDHGRVIAQKTIPLNGESAEQIEEKAKAAEPGFYVETLGKILSGEIAL